MRPARSRTWAADSSPETYSVRWPDRADRAATSSSRVDLPTPGSPASSTTAPGTMPPPSTRSSSARPVDRDAASTALTCAIGVAGDETGPAVTLLAFGAPISTTLPQAWHSPQRPIQRAVVQPHSPHWYGDRPVFAAAFAMSVNLDRATDKPVDPRSPDRGNGCAFQRVQEAWC